MVVNESNPYDIFSQNAQRDVARYDLMRTQDPVHAAIHPETGQTYWFLTRYDDCLSFLKDKRFGKEFRRHLPQDLSHKWGTGNTESIINQHMLNLDDPAHSRLRSLVNLAFSPTRIDNLRPRLQMIADHLFDVIERDVIDGDELDLTEQYIGKFPLMAIAAMLGIPADDYQLLYGWTQNLLLPEQATVHQSIVEFTDYLNEKVDLRLKNPDLHDDLLSALVFAEESGDRLSRQELLSMVYLLITAGYETMVNFISNGVTCLFENPIQLQLLCENLDDQTIVKSAIEEMLRYCGPSHMTLASWAFEDVRFGDKVIRMGDIVHAVLFAANRDPLIFADPHRFDILRSPNKHIAFSYGIHHCLGAALARLEGEIAIKTLLSRLALY